MAEGGRLEFPPREKLPGPDSQVGSAHALARVGSVVKLLTILGPTFELPDPSLTDMGGAGQLLPAGAALLGAGARRPAAVQGGHHAAAVRLGVLRRCFRVDQHACSMGSPPEL